MIGDDVGVASEISVTLRYDITLRPSSGVQLQVSELSGDLAMVGVGAVAVVVLVGLAIFVAPEVALGAGLMAVGAAAAS